MDKLELTLNSPLTEEQMDAISDVDFDNTSRIWFNTKHGKIVEFVKQKHGKWIDHQFDGMNKSILYAIECSACNDVFTEVDPTEKPIKCNFCPSCGARMEWSE